MKENYIRFLNRSQNFLSSLKNEMEQKVLPHLWGNATEKTPERKLDIKKAGTSLRPYALMAALAFSVVGWGNPLAADTAFFQDDCTTAPVIAGVSNITANTAVINWNMVTDATTPTYTLEVYTDAAYTALFGSYTGITNLSYSLTGLTINTTYYYRVKVDNTTCGDYASGSFTAQEGFTPLDVTGFTEDVIANGTGPALNSTTSSVDNSESGGANFAYLSMDYKLNETSADLTFGLPVNRRLTSPTNSSLQYILHNYSEDNSLRLPNQNNSGTLTLTQPVALTNLYLAVASGDGSSTITVDVTFSDNTTQTVTGLGVTNWDSAAPANSPAIITNIGRVKRTSGVTSTGNFKLFQLNIPIDAANQSKLVSSITVTKTDTGTNSKIPNIFAVSGKLASSCIEVATTSATIVSPTSVELSWNLAEGDDATGVTYTVEVYTDENYTTQVAGSPYTAVAGTTQLVTGLSLGNTYYYKVQASNGTCDSAFATGSVTIEYCEPTSGNPNSYAITNVSTTGGFTNISNASGTGVAYTNLSATQIASKTAGSSIDYSVTRTSIYSLISVWVDWNNDLDFDDEGELINAFPYGSGQPLTATGTINIPAGTALGNYRMRVRSAYYWNTTMSPCGNLSYGETEDYTIAVVEQPADCATPGTPSLELYTTTGIEGVASVTGDAPTGYVIIRSTSETLDATPANGTLLTMGTAFGGGTVVASGTGAGMFMDNAVNSNTEYYYFAYAYNDGGVSCYGPIYSAIASEVITTCPSAAIASGASDITYTSATIHWSSVGGGDASEVTYTLEIYNDEALSDMEATYTTTDYWYAVSGLTPQSTYYYRVKAGTASCPDGTWSAVMSFTATEGYSPIDVTGYNADVIANGVGIANLSTTNAVDAVNNSYIALNYNPNGTVSTIGLPLNRILANGNIKFVLQDYSDNNALRLPAQNQSGTLTLVNPVKASNVYLAVTSGSGPSTISATITFADNTTQTVTGIAVADWYGTSPNILISGIGRANRSNTTGAVETGNSKVFYVTLAIDAANQDKNITSLEITKTSAGATEPVPNIFAVAAQVLLDDLCPELASVSTTATTDGAEVTFTLENESSAVTSYSISVYTDAEMTTEVDGSPFTTATTSLTLTGLSPLTTYYYSATGVGADCSSEAVTGSFTTTCEAPENLLIAAQTVCAGTTVADIEVTAAEGAVVNWYADETAETPLADNTALTTGTYYVSQTVAACESTAVTVSVTVNSTPAPDADAVQTFCTGATAEALTATAADGATLTWFNSENVMLNGTEDLVSGTYYVSQTANGCESVQTEITVTVNETPEAPVANAAQDFCTGATATELDANAADGATLVWYNADNMMLDGTETLVTGSYYVAQTLGECESAMTEIMVTVNTTPDAPVATTEQTYCSGSLTDELQADASAGATLVWYDGNTSVLNGTEELTAGTYYVTQVMNGCESAATEVTVTVNPTPDVPTGNEDQEFTEGETVGDLDVSYAEGAASNWYMLDLTGNLVSVTATDALVDGGVYYVSQTVNGCESDYLVITASFVLGNAGFDKAHLAVYPNPAHEVLNISYNNAITNIVVTNMLGQTVIEQKANANTVQVNTALLPAGNYIVQVYSANGMATVKVVKK